MMTFAVRIAIVVTIVLGAGLLFTFERPPVETVQLGYRGTGMEHVANPRVIAEQIAWNPPQAPSDPVEPDGPKASEIYQNVQVLGDLSEIEFLRVMTAITEWVAPPEQGCLYCHAEGEELSSDKLYTKVVSRKMLEMTRHINTAWTSHVGDTGVTCWTCHRGQPVPTGIWFEAANRNPEGALGNSAGQNHPAWAANRSSLPYDPFTPFLTGVNDHEIRNISGTALPVDNRSSIKQAEWTYSLMMHMSQSLGVNCTFCHNSRAFAQWDESTPKRTTAWHGIRMVRDLNADYLTPLQPVYPPIRLGALGDAPKANCATCHKGVYKPMFGAPAVKDWPELARTGQRAAVTPDPAAPVQVVETPKAAAGETPRSE